MLSLLISHFLRKKSESGFTLLELIVVMLMATILSLTAYPQVMGQVGKARETEAKQTLSALGQGQQAYFFEKANFANQLDQLDVGIGDSTYYQYTEPTIGSLSSPAVKHKATPLNAAVNNTRNYELGVYYNNGSFTLLLCQSLTHSSTAEAPNTLGVSCLQGTNIQ